MRHERANGDGSPVVEAMDAAAIAAKAGELAGLLVDCAARGNAFGCPTGLREEAAREYWDRVSREVAAGRARARPATRGGGILGTLVLRWRAVGGGAPAGRIDLDAPIVATDGARHEVVPALLARVDAEASLRMASLVAIEVQASSPDAAQLRRRGFRLSGRIPHGAGPGQDALLFWKDPSAGAPAPLPAPPPRDGVELVAHDRLFRSYLAIDRFEVRHRLFAGGTSGVIGRDLLVRGPAAAILLYDPERDQVALVEQFRIGALAAGMDPWILETVAGVVEPGEDAAEVAVREAFEEAGARVEDIVHVARHLSSPGCSDETVETFVGRVDAARLGGIHGLAEEGEDIRVVVMDASEAIAACADGRIDNAITLVALQWLALNRAALAARWRRA
ncbi:MAG: NUDIX domain-containing protein [Alphaproteobacteria bacterium]